MSFTLGLAMLVSATFGTSTAATTLQAPAPFVPQSQTVEQYVRSYFSDVPVMAEIAHCESKFRQYDKNGNVLHGQVYNDLGVMQVNQYYHGAEAEALGLDLTTIEGNVEFARYLYDREGTTPWLSSSKCWNKDKGTSQQLALNK